MNHIKRADAIRKQNIDLLKKVEDLEFQIKEINEQDKQDKDKIKILLSELELIKDKWLESIRELEKLKIEYEDLIFSVSEVKNIMLDMTGKISLWQKIRIKILKHFK